MANSINLFLKNQNFKIIMVHDGKDAIEKFYDETPDLVLLDINLPNVNGWDIYVMKLDVTLIFLLL